MRVTQTKEVTVCDVCHVQSSWLDTCLACGQEYCTVCHATIAGCMVRADLCKLCGTREDVKAVIMKFAPRFKRLMDERAEALRAFNVASLGKRKKKVVAE